MSGDQDRGYAFAGLTLVAVAAVIAGLVGLVLLIAWGISGISEANQNFAGLLLFAACGAVAVGVWQLRELAGFDSN